MPPIKFRPATMLSPVLPSSNVAIMNKYGLTSHWLLEDISYYARLRSQSRK